MNKLVVSVHDQNRASKQIHKTKKKSAVKVVYISNPMKVNTSASEFRALVQELTGRDSDIPASAFLEHSKVDHNQEEEVAVREEEKEMHKEDQEEQAAVLCVEEDDEKLSVPTMTTVGSTPHLVNGGSDLLISLQDINGYFSPSNFWYESAFHVDGSKV